MPVMNIPQTPGRVPLNVYANVANIPAWQYVGETSSIGGSFTQGHSQITEYWDISNPTTNLPLFIQQFLGYATSLGPGLGIRRNNPRQHPVLQYLYAASVTGLQGVGPIGKVPFKTLDGAAAWGDWNLLRVGVSYETPPYHILSDGTVGANTAQAKEYLRYTVIISQPEVKFLSREGGEYNWPAGSPDIGNAIRPKINVRQVYQNIRIKWVNVPDIGLFNGANGSATPGAYPANLDAYLGTVNSAAFLGKAVGTVLFTGYTLTPRSFPYNNPNWNTIGLVPRAWDVDLEFSFFQPTGPNGTTGGHNYIISPSTHNWYLVTDKNGNSPYQSLDLNNIFLMSA